jgi:hypothetical protein
VACYVEDDLEKWELHIGKTQIFLQGGESPSKSRERERERGKKREPSQTKPELCLYTR